MAALPGLQVDSTDLGFHTRLCRIDQASAVRRVRRCPVKGLVVGDIGDRLVFQIHLKYVISTLLNGVEGDEPAIGRPGRLARLPKSRGNRNLLDQFFFINVEQQEYTITLRPRKGRHLGAIWRERQIAAHVGAHGQALGDWISVFGRVALGDVFENLAVACADGQNLAAREGMALASFYGGLAITNALVGYVHAISHNLGAKYGVPHGLGNAMVLPHVLEMLKDVSAKKLGEIAVHSGLGDSSESDAALAQKVIDKVWALNAEIGIPKTTDVIKTPSGFKLHGEFLITLFDAFSESVRAYQFVQTEDYSVELRYIPMKGKKIDPIISNVLLTIEKGVKSEIKIGSKQVNKMIKVKGKAPLVISQIS